MIELKQAAVELQGTPVLKKIDLFIPTGEHLCILGPNGCGKTTLLKTIAGLLPYKGTVTIDGNEVQAIKRRLFAQKVGLMSQFTTVYFDYTVYETVLMGRYSHRQGGFFSSASNKDKEKVLECLAVTGLLEQKDQPVNQLSGGQQQRVFLAKILAQNPEIILLDEPNNHLDMKHQIELVEYLKIWANQENKTIIGVFHDIRLALSLSRQVLFLKEGQIVKKGDFLEVASKELLQEIFDIDLLSYFQEQELIWAQLADKH